MLDYTTVQGDTWDLIGFKLFGPGGEKQTDQLIRANISHAHQVIFQAGVKLRVPAEVRPEPQGFEGMPPWKR